MTGYVRQSIADIQTDEVVEALPLNNEFNALEAAFDGNNGHTHDGTVGNSPKINLTDAVTDVLAINHGGTGKTTAVSAADALSTQGTDIASATTTDLSLATGVAVTVTGTTTITSFGIAPKGVKRWITFAGILTLTYDPTKLILPTGANIITAVADTCLAISLGSGLWRVSFYQRGDGKSLSLSTASEILEAIKTVDGAGSDLDADLLDGQHGAYYRSLTNATDTILTANLPTRLSTAGASIPSDDYNLAIDSGFYVGSGASSVNGPPFTASYGPLLVMKRSSVIITQLAMFGNAATPPTIVTRGTEDGGSTWSAWTRVANYNDVWNSTNDGSGSGLDADLLDGQHGAYYLNAANMSGTFTSLTTSGAISATGDITSGGTVTATGGFVTSAGSVSGNHIIASGGYFRGSTTNTVFGNTTSGTVYLRPVAYNSSTSQATLDSSGNFTISGHFVAPTVGVFRGSTSQLVLGSQSTSGDSATIYLRPQGWNTSAGEATLTSNGNFETAGNVTSGGIVGSMNGDFRGLTAGQTTYLMANGASIALRPNGGSDSTGQAILSTTGVFTTASNIVSGNYLYAGGASGARFNIDGDINGTAWGGWFSTWLNNTYARQANIPAYIAVTSAGAVGSYAFLKSGSSYSAGSTLAGANLFYSNDTGSTTSSGPSGSWRSMGLGSANTASVWLRYA